MHWQNWRRSRQQQHVLLLALPIPARCAEIVIFDLPAPPQYFGDFAALGNPLAAAPCSSADQYSNCGRTTAPCACCRPRSLMRSAGVQSPRCGWMRSTNNGSGMLSSSMQEAGSSSACCNCRRRV